MVEQRLFTVRTHMLHDITKVALQIAPALGTVTDSTDLLTYNVYFREHDWVTYNRNY